MALSYKLLRSKVLVLPEDTDKPKIGTVVQVADGGCIVKPGDTIYFRRDGGVEIEVDDVEYLLLDEQDIMGFYRPPEEPED